MGTNGGITLEYVNEVTALLNKLLPRVGDPDHDQWGVMTSSLSGLNRDVGVARFVLHHDVVAFRQHLRDASEMKLSLFIRSQGGEVIDSSYLTIMNYQTVLDALAAQEIELAIEIARYMGGDDDINRKRPPSFAAILGYLLQAVVLNDAAEITKWLPQFERVCTQKQFMDFRPYLDVIQALYVSDLSTANSSFQVHPRFWGAVIYSFM